MRVLVTGGTRSGKSAVAEGLLPADAPVTYVATATPSDAASDAEMADRIARHRSRRPAAWRTVEAEEVGQAVQVAPGPVLVDSVGLWVARRMGSLDLWQAGSLAPLVDEAATWFADPARDVVVVAEQVGGGLQPLDAGSRRWVDAVGEVTARLASLADRVLLVVAGRVLELPPGDPAPLPGGAGAAGGAQAPAGASDRVDLHAHGDAMVPHGAVDMAVNVLDQPPPAHVARAIDLAATTAYPDQGPALRAVAAATGLTPDHVVLLPGAAEAFWLVPHALRPRRAAVVHPTFTAPDAALRACGIPTTRVARDAGDGWRLRPERVPDDADLVVLGTPNNPTGTLDDPAAIAQLCRPGRTVLVDEAFMDFVVGHSASLAGRVDLPGLVVVRSVTKLWSLPGVRAGWLVTAPDVARALRAHQQPWPVSGAAVAAIAAAADGDAWRTETAEGVAVRRRAMVERLRRVEGVAVHDGAANFVLLEVPSGPAVHRALLARGIAVRPSTFPLLGPDLLRVAVREADVVERLAAALEEILTPGGGR